MVLRHIVSVILRGLILRHNVRPYFVLNINLGEERGCDIRIDRQI